MAGAKMCVQCCLRTVPKIRNIAPTLRWPTALRCVLDPTISPEIGPTGAKLGRNRTKLDTKAMFRRIRVAIAPTWTRADLGEIRADGLRLTFGGIHNIVRIRLRMSAEFTQQYGKVWSESGRHYPNSTMTTPTRAKLGPCGRRCQGWSNFSHCALDRARWHGRWRPHVCALRQQAPVMPCSPMGERCATMRRSSTGGKLGRGTRTGQD